MQGTAWFKGENVTVLDTYKDKALVILVHNPIDCQWVKIEELDNITWVISSRCA